MEPEVGDLIEISRVGYKHWAIYVGKGYVIHLVPPSETPYAGSASMMSVLHDKALVKKEKLLAVVGSNKYRVNNLLDDKYEPRDVDMIVKIAQSQVGQMQPYSIATKNCEHFVTDLRYGKPTSRQVRQVVAAATIAAGVFGLIAAAALISSSGKEKKKKKKKNKCGYQQHMG